MALALDTLLQNVRVRDQHPMGWEISTPWDGRSALQVGAYHGRSEGQLSVATTGPHLLVIARSLDETVMRTVCYILRLPELASDLLC